MLADALKSMNILVSVKYLLLAPVWYMTCSLL
jgi:hypothetical protein